MKRTLPSRSNGWALALALVSLTPLAGLAQVPGARHNRGDLDRDRVVAAADLRLLAGYLAGNAAGFPSGPGAADWDEDGAVTLLDLVWQNQAMAGCAVDDLVRAGFRASRLLSPFPGAAYWEGVGDTVAGRRLCSIPGGVWIVGLVGDEGDCLLNFPSPGGAWPHVSFRVDDQNEAWLDWFDTRGLEVWLQVEPGLADVPTLLGLVLDRYGHHPCVIGCGIDVEWLGYPSFSAGRAVTDADALAWSVQVRGYDPAYTLFLKHWLTGKMPPSARTGLVFVDDSQGFPSLSALVAEFQEWGAHFAPAPVGFQFGYAADRTWWQQLDDPPSGISAALLGAVPNTAGLFWVDFTVYEVFPP